MDKVPDHAEHIDDEEDGDDLRGNGAGPHLPPLRLGRRRHRQGMATARTGPRPRQDRGAPSGHRGGPVIVPFIVPYAVPGEAIPFRRAVRNRNFH